MGVSLIPDNGERVRKRVREHPMRRLGEYDGSVCGVRLWIYCGGWEGDGVGMGLLVLCFLFPSCESFAFTRHLLLCTYGV